MQESLHSALFPTPSGLSRMYFQRGDQTFCLLRLLLRLYPGIEQVRSMEGIVRHALSVNPQTDIVFMYFVDPDKINDYNKGIIPAEIKNHESVAAHYNIPSVNLVQEAQSGLITWN